VLEAERQAGVGRGGGLHNYVMESGLITVERRAWRMLDDPRLKAT